MEKAHRTLTLLKSYYLNIIMLQKTNLENLNTRNFLQQQWGYSSYWTSKTAILIGNSNISLTKTQNSYNRRVIVAELIYKKHPFKLTNVYAPPNIEDRTSFFNNWALQIDERCINILAGDFNTNLNPQTNRISHAPPTSDPTRTMLSNLTVKFMDTASITQEEEPFITFYQNTRGGRRMATRLDYIFIDANHGHCCKHTTTQFSNSDHLLVECKLQLASGFTKAKQ